MENACQEETGVSCLANLSGYLWSVSKWETFAWERSLRHTRRMFGQDNIWWCSISDVKSKASGDKRIYISCCCTITTYMHYWCCQKQDIFQHPQCWNKSWITPKACGEASEDIEAQGTNIGRLTLCSTESAIFQRPLSCGGCHPDLFTAGLKASSGGVPSVCRAKYCHDRYLYCLHSNLYVFSCASVSVVVVITLFQPHQAEQMSTHNKKNVRV